MVTFWLNGEETSSETESALEQGGKEKDYVIKVLIPLSAAKVG